MARHEPAMSWSVWMILADMIAPRYGHLCAMTMRRKFVLIGLSLATVLSCPFFGFVYNLPEERREGGWDLFIKPSPNFNFFFKNPRRQSTILCI